MTYQKEILKALIPLAIALVKITIVILAKK
jgi:nitrogen fixation-related uncharacterized protein